MDIRELNTWVMTTFEDVVPQYTWGEHAYFYNPGGLKPRGTYFLTIKQQDGANDKASHLDRPGVWRLNFGLPKASFIHCFGLPPSRPGKGMTVEGPWDFTALDQLMPHPVYGWMAWASILNPSQKSFETLKPLIMNAYNKARDGFDKRSGLSKIPKTMGNL